MAQPSHSFAGERLPVLAGGLFVIGAVASFVGIALFALLYGRVDAALLTVWRDPVIHQVLRFTLLQAALSTLLSLAFAIPVASALARQRRFPGRIWLIRLMAVPMGLPVLIGALGLIGIWGRQGLGNQALQFLGLDQPISIYGLTGILIAHVFFNMPLAVRFMLAALERVPAEHWRTAAGLGLSPLSIFRFIEWPVLARVVPGAAGLIFMLCVTSFTLILIFGGGPAATTIEVAIYQAIRFDFDPGRAVSLAVLQIAVTSLLLVLISLLPGARDPGQVVGRRVDRFDGRGLGIRMADGFLLVFASLFLVLPLGQVVVAGLQADLLDLISKPSFQRAALTSLWVSLAAALLAVFGSLLIIRARQRLEETRQVSLFGRMLMAMLSATSSLVLLVPVTVLATGWFLILRQVGDVSRFAPAIVIGINALMALPFAVRVLSPAYVDHRIRSRLLAASLGLKGPAKWRLIDLPVLKRSLLAAFTFSMALSLGDLGAVVLFGSENISTLPTLIYASLGSYRSNDADGLALLLGIFCLALALIGAPKLREEDMRHDDR
ncbi:thiamine/thiamine pyrophosphate ABC transporter permease ThiP [Peteryoungia desertarenae]|uniref:Thiamine/thiamine pyrophosphate ABC transporter permease ThiP n=1 Tax=Peteryoungia desertarenae TaxID=1813451 RepID=A0ABX6QSU2_9HYPH|nr:thiamine/thiamine pyrophosphate ABC transporter permease ThiP [Peteryoungia desertarenae]QLF71265.1 thiamine/thiamine pyrophosphate ABC transporter permease ThiP [Peteryoungia desertarenae]